MMVGLDRLTWFWHSFERARPLLPRLLPAFESLVDISNAFKPILEDHKQCMMILDFSMPSNTTEQSGELCQPGRQAPLAFPDPRAISTPMLLAG